MKRRQFLVNSSKLLAVTPLLSRLSLADSSSEELTSTITKIIKNSSQMKGKSLTLLFPKGSEPNLKPIVEAFKAQTGVNVKCKEGSLDTIATEILLEDRLAGIESSIDIALPATFAIADLVEAGAIENISKYAKKYEPHDFQASSMYKLGDYYNSKLYGYQADGDAYLMFYNKDFLENPKFKSEYFKKYSQKLEVPKTWEELDRQVEFFNRPKQGLYGGSLFRNKDYLAWEYWVRLHAKGIFPADANMRPQFASAKGLTALKELIATSKSLAPETASDGLFDNFKNFSKGKSFCNVGWGGTQKYLMSSNSPIKDKLLYAPLPGGNFKGEEISIPYFNWGWNYVVSSKSKNKELAYLFCLYASSTKMSTKAVRQEKGYFDPFRTEHYEDQAIQKTYGIDFLKVHQSSLRNSIPDFYIRGRGEYFEALKSAVHLSNTNKLDPEFALNKAAQRWEELTEKLGRKNQAKQWLILKKSYPNKLLTLLT